MHERSAQRLEEHVAVEMARAMLGYLARPARGHVLVTLPAALRVVDGSQSVRVFLHLLEDEAVVVEGPQRHDRVFLQRIERRPLWQKTVGETVEACRGLAEPSHGEAGRLRRGRLLVVRGAADAEAVDTVCLGIDQTGDERRTQERTRAY